MSGDAERVEAFLLLFVVADLPLLGVVALPEGPGSALGGLALVVLSWIGTGLFIVAAARAEVQPRGVIDGVWVATTVTPPVAILALAYVSPTSPEGGAALAVPGAVVTTILLVSFWIIYALGGDAGPAPFRRRREAVAPEDWTGIASMVVVPLVGGLGLALAGVEPSGGALALLFLGVPATVILGAEHVGSSRRDRRWSAVADRLGFSEEKSHLRYPDLVGARGGRACRLQLKDRMARYVTFWRTRVAVDLAETPDGELHLEPERRLSRLQQALGARDADLGAPGLDGDVLADVDDPDLARRVLRAAARDPDGGFSAVREGLPEVWERLESVEIHPNRDRLVARVPGVVDPDEAEAVLGLLEPMAEAVEETVRERTEKQRTWGAST
jgi:hypothetical protein